MYGSRWPGGTLPLLTEPGPLGFNGDRSSMLGLGFVSKFGSEGFWLLSGVNEFPDNGGGDSALGIEAAAMSASRLLK